MADQTDWKELYSSALQVVADTQKALGFDDDEVACANGSLEIVAEIEDLKETIVFNGRCEIELSKQLKGMRASLELMQRAIEWCLDNCAFRADSEIVQLDDGLPYVYSTVAVPAEFAEFIKPKAAETK